MLYVPVSTNEKKTPLNENNLDLQEFVVGRETNVADVKFSISAKFKTLFQKEMQAYYVKPNDTDESIMR